ncbi:MAG: hypothetical protein DDT22_00748 [candidate division WS2 bacterium]|nr:hypothetical protein [Candidatus Lithacetigena glycinireducens]
MGSRAKKMLSTVARLGLGCGLLQAIEKRRIMDIM